MASRKEQHQARVAAIAGLGKWLTRRAKSSCELCAADQPDLRPIEILPVEEAPSLDAAILACARCRALIEGGKLPREPAELRFLEGSAWAELEPVKLTALRLLRKLATADVSWARETLDSVWVDEDLEAKL